MQLVGATNASPDNLCQPCRASNTSRPANKEHMTPFHLAVITASLPVISRCAFGWCLAVRHNIEADVCLHL